MSDVTADSIRRDKAREQAREVREEERASDLRTQYGDPRTWPMWPVRKYVGAFTYFRDGSHAYEGWLGQWTALARIDGERVTWVQHVPSMHRARFGATGRTD